MKLHIEIAVGFFVLLGILALVFLSLKVSNLAFVDQKAGYILQARFNNIGGLTERAAIKAGGVKIGRVKSIDYDYEKHQAVVDLHIENEKILFSVDTSVRILTAGLLGEQYISFEAGGLPLTCDAEDIDSIPGLDCGTLGKEIKVVNLTQSAIILENLIGQVLKNLGSK